MKKKVISVLLATVMSAALLAGCGSSEEAAPAAEPAAEEAEESAADEAADETAEEPAEESTDTADADAPACKGALEGVTLVVGTSGTYAPFSYFAEDGVTLQGYDVDFLNALQEVLGFEISGGEIEDMDYGPLGTSLSQGQLDIGAAALCATDERKKSMNFTDIYYDAGIIVAVAEDNDTITGVDDLTSGEYTVALQTGTIAYEYGVANLPEDCIQAYDSQALAYKAVEDGQADATIYDLPGTAYSIKTGEIHLKVVGDEFYTGQAPYALALSFNICDKYPEIVDNFNDAIAYLSESGKLDELKAKWCE
ncbi:MAG: ABC transporter substrate-binding protein [Lachnospiraceae bacterium]